MYPSKNHQSFGIFVKNQVEALRKKGLDVDVAAITDPRMGKIHVLKKYLLWAIKIGYRLAFRGKKYDMIHAHYVFPSGLFALLFKNIYKVPFVVTAHGGDIDRMARKSSFFLQQTKKIMNEAKQVIAVGEKLKSDIIKDFEIPEEKVCIINMGVNRAVFKPMPKQEAKKRLQLSEEYFHFLFVGNKIKAKGLLELVQAFKRLKQTDNQVMLHLIGADKSPSFTQQLKTMIQEEKIKDVFFYPSMTQKEVATWMSAADTFVLPSHMEGFGLVAVEAMSCHAPVVASDVGGLSYLLNDGAGVLTEPKNVDSLYHGMKKVLEDQELRLSLIESGERKASDNDEQIQLNKLLRVYGMNGAR